jgi:polyketide biosynthesis enoyl-CoA hydratase PksH
VGVVSYETLRVRQQGSIWFVQFHRPDAGNAINSRLVAECADAIARCRESATVVVLEGLPDVFCAGADFHDLAARDAQGRSGEADPGVLYDLWLDLATGPYVTVAHVRGQVNAGGIGFVAACDLVLADESARFSLSELLFGLMPACVLPFLIRRVGVQKANYLTLTTQAVSTPEAHRYGLVDAYDGRSDELLRRHLLRLRRLSKVAVTRYKNYLGELRPELAQGRAAALAANREVFTDRHNLDAIARYVRYGEFPWERSA